MPQGENCGEACTVHVSSRAATYTCTRACARTHEIPSLESSYTRVAYVTGDLVFVRGTRRGVGVGPDVERGWFLRSACSPPPEMCVFFVAIVSEPTLSSFPSSRSSPYSQEAIRVQRSWIHSLLELWSRESSSGHLFLTPFGKYFLQPPTRPTPSRLNALSWARRLRLIYE